LELTFVAMWAGFGIGLARDWRRPQIASDQLRRASAFKAGGSLGAKLGAFVFIYTGSYLAVRHVRSVPPSQAADVPSSVVGGALAGMVFGVPAGPHAATMGLLRGAALGFGFGVTQDIAAGVIASLEEDLVAEEAAASVAGQEGGGFDGVPGAATAALERSEAAAAPATPAEEAAALASHLEALAKRMQQHGPPVHKGGNGVPAAASALAGAPTAQLAATGARAER
jgi:hypothetical protein